VEWLRKKGESYDIVVVLQPTSPLRISSDIDSAIELIFKKRASSIVSVCPTELKPSWISAIPAGGSMKEFLWRTKNAGGSRSPSPVFRLNGALYVVQSKTLKSGGFYGNRPYAFVMPRERSVDIDDEFDFRFAEFLAKNRKKR
jgi:N-acylneuraminate cytidylyltransferase/CMP-N,N'-diacetyllegionaminic acid synthase